MAVYRLAKTNVLYNAGDEGNPDLMVQVGEEVARGVEMDVAGDILPNWHVQASYAYTNAKITKTATDTEKDFGLQRPNTPRHSMNIWSKYIIEHGSLRNLGLGLGFNAVSSRYGQVILATDSSMLPSTTASVIYRCRPTSTMSSTVLTGWAATTSYAPSPVHPATSILR